MVWCFPAAIPRRAGRIGRTAVPSARFDHGDRGEEQGIPAAIPRRAGRIGRTAVPSVRFDHGDRRECVVSSGCVRGR